MSGAKPDIGVPPFDCSVYIIAADLAVGPVKIGIAKSPETRCRDLQTGHYRRLILAGTYCMPDRAAAKYVEEAFHSTQEKYRLHGEWFDMSPAKAFVIMTIAIGTLLSVHTDLSSEEINRGLRENGWRLDNLPMPPQLKGDHGPDSHH